MLRKIFSTFDTKLGIWSPPVCHTNKHEMFRVIDELVNGGRESKYSKNPEDFAVYEIGEFDDSPLGGKFHEQPIHQANFVELAKPREETKMLALLKQFIAQQNSNQQ